MRDGHPLLGHSKTWRGLASAIVLATCAAVLIGLPWPLGVLLGVRYVLEGSVQRDQINAQLVDAETGAHLWADRFEEDVADLFKLQDEVVERLGRSLGFALTKAEAEKGGRSKNPDSTDLTMRGDDVLWQCPKEFRDCNKEARALYERALEINPNDSGL